MATVTIDKSLVRKLLKAGLISWDKAMVFLGPSYRGPCIRCGSKSNRLDYVCGTCSNLKAKSPRRFWQSVMERSQKTEKK